MRRETISRALNGMDEKYINEAAAFRPGAIQKPPERIVHMKKKRIITFALAAVLVLGLGAVAYAADLFGLRALLITDGYLTDAESDGSYLSFTQPQDVPEEIDPAIREKIANSAKAWAEWDAWRLENSIQEPESCKSPENTRTSTVEDNGDGTVTMIFYSDGNAETEIERRVVSSSDYEQFTAYWELRAKGFEGYDYSYHVYTQEMADKLESIAASYGLKLRHQRTQMFQRYGDQTDGSSREEITARINEVCAGGGRFFRVEPSGYDMFYYYDEGTFAVSFFTTENLTNAGTSCYFYNSPYDTLSSGYEFFEQVQDINSFRTRNHTTPDGTEITILQNDTDVYAYVYLESSFVTLHIVQIEGLGDAEIDAILDMVDYSTIR